MKHNDARISLAGWGHEQVVLHIWCHGIGLSVWSGNHLRSFSLTPWLKGKIALINSPLTRTREDEGVTQKIEHTVLRLRQEAVRIAVAAMRTEDIFVLSEAVTTTYAAQQLMGDGLLPNLGEIGKRHSKNFGVYLFSHQKRITKKLRTNSVLVA